MTVPSEEIRTLQYTRQFLFRLLQPRLTPRIPQAIREEARQLLKHYPADFRVAEIYQKVK